MNWYLAKIVFRITCGDGNHTAQFDEQLKLVAASTESEAFDRSVMFGLEGEDRFLNQKQQLVRWEFVNVAEVLPLYDLSDGAELYSRINEVDDADAYADSVHRRAAALREAAHSPLLQTA